MKALLFGIGQMGQCIAWALDQLDYEVHTVDENYIPLNGKIGQGLKYFHQADVWNPDELGEVFDVVGDTDIVISALPYFCNLLIATACVNRGLRYCDLGGSVSQAKEIVEMASESASVPVMTDLGLAPGWINLMVENLIRQRPDCQPKSITMAVGGIPSMPRANWQQYTPTWSMDGLLNEYREDCVVLDNGIVHKIPALSHLEPLEYDSNKFEMFTTSGGMAHTIWDMQSKGVKNCIYKTIRWPGHRELINHLLRCGISDESICKVLTHDAGNISDKIILVTQIAFDNEPAACYINSREGVRSFSAMQAGTAFPLVAVAVQLSQGGLDYTVCPTYYNVDYDSFNTVVERLYESKHNQLVHR